MRGQDRRKERARGERIEAESKGEHRREHSRGDAALNGVGGKRRRDIQMKKERCGNKDETAGLYTTSSSFVVVVVCPRDHAIDTSVCPTPTVVPGG